MNNIYISSNAFPRKDLDSIYEACSTYDIHHLELGSGVAYDPDAREKIISYSKKIKIILHNYAPAPREPFVLNLASPDKDISKKSKHIVENALEISAEIGSPIYAVHAGFAYHAEAALLGKGQTQLEHFPLSEARNIFLNNIVSLAQLAKRFGVKLLLENNALPFFNLINGQNLSYLLVSTEDSLDLLSACAELGVGLLLDVGHLKVSSNALRFDPIDFMAKIRYYIGAFHVSENSGKLDEHTPISDKSWFLGILKIIGKDLPITIEVDGHLDEVIANAGLLKNFFTD